MLEHYIFILEVPVEIYNGLMSEITQYSSTDPMFQHYVSFFRFSVIEDKNKDLHAIVSMSATAINYLWDTTVLTVFPKSMFAQLCSWMELKYGLLIKRPEQANDISLAFIPNDVRKSFNKIKVLDTTELAAYVHDDISLGIYMTHASMTVKWITDRGNSHEIVRHRPASYAQESTRYVMYAGDKCGNEITCIRPVFFEYGSEKYLQWKLACEEAETAYKELVRLGCTAQEARDVLPNSLKTEIVMTARLTEWKHFFKMRVPKSAHPEMRQISIPTMQAMTAAEALLLGEENAIKMFGGIEE